MMKLRKGSITVFLCIVLAVLIPLCTILIDLARYNEAKKIAESSLKVCTESMLAAYDTQLKEQFGLFAMYPRDDMASMEKEVYELLSDNLSPENAEGKVTDLYGFKVNRVEVTPIYNYSEPYVLEQQVTEFMKYRAPVQAVSEFLEKLKTMGGLMKEGDMVEKNMNIDKLLNGIRENMIYFTLLLDEKMKTINDFGSGYSKSGLSLESILKNNENVGSCMPKVERIDEVNKYRSEYISAYAIYNQAQKDADGKESTKNGIYERMEDIKYQITAKNEELDKENKKEDPDTSGINDQIEAFQSELKAEEENYAAAQEEYNKAAGVAAAAKSKVDIIQGQLNKAIDLVVSCYLSIDEKTQETIGLLEGLRIDLELHISYCSKAIELANAIIPQASEIQSETKILEDQIKENSDSAVSGQISADMKKKLLSVDVGAFNGMITQLDTDKRQLEDWLQDIITAKDAYMAASDILTGEFDKLNKIKSDPNDSTVAGISAYIGYNGIDEVYKKLSEEIRNYQSYPDMKRQNIYVIPEYTLEPPPTAEEKNGFKVWYSNTFGDGSENPPEQKDTGELDKAKTTLGGSASIIATEKSEEVSNISLDEFFSTMEAGILTIPSDGGSVSSDINLQSIAAEVYNTQEDQVVSPFDEAPQGYDGKIDEKQKNFFDYEMERIRKLLDIVTNLLAHTGESLVKSLYMNEYIVSAFKSSTTKDNKLEYDIGWERPLDTTFFKQGEVEYVIFGNHLENANISASKRSIFAIRLIFNLLHVYTDPGKVASALEIATMLAGWTIFGVPIVQNLILIGWAGLESWIDANALMNGKEVPLIKTTQSWVLDYETLKNYLLNSAATELGNLLKDKATDIIERTAASLEETVTSFIDARIDELFIGVEDGVQQAGDIVSSEATNLVGVIILPDVPDMSTETLDKFLEPLKNYLSDAVKSFFDQAVGQTKDFIAECKTAIKEKIRNAIFESAAYIDLKAKIIKIATDAIDNGVSMVSSKVETMLGASDGRSSGGNNVMGRLIMMDYTDYLRLMLLAVPGQTKALRVSDLMQLDMYKTAPDNSKPMSNYYTALYVKAYIDMNTWFIPEGLFKNDNDGMIVVEWSMGY